MEFLCGSELPIPKNTAFGRVVSRGTQTGPVPDDFDENNEETQHLANIVKYIKLSNQMFIYRSDAAANMIMGKRQADLHREYIEQQCVRSRLKVFVDQFKLRFPNQRARFPNIPSVDAPLPRFIERPQNQPAVERQEPQQNLVAELQQEHVQEDEEIDIVNVPPEEQLAQLQPYLDLAERKRLEKRLSKKQYPKLEPVGPLPPQELFEPDMEAIESKTPLQLVNQYATVFPKPEWYVKEEPMQLDDMEIEMDYLFE